MSKKQQVLSEEVLEQIAGGFDTNSPMFKVGVGIAAGLVGLVGGAGAATGIGYGIWGRGKSKAEKEIEDLKKQISGTSSYDFTKIVLDASADENAQKLIVDALGKIGVKGKFTADSNDGNKLHFVLEK